MLRWYRMRWKCLRRLASLLTLSILYLMVDLYRSAMEEAQRGHRPTVGDEPTGPATLQLQVFRYTGGTDWPPIRRIQGYRKKASRELGPSEASTRRRKKGNNSSMKSSSNNNNNNNNSSAELSSALDALEAAYLVTKVTSTLYSAPESLTSKLSRFRSALNSTEKAMLLDTARRFRRIADENGLTYFLYGGALLGSYRHQDVIPWDDDLDFFVDARHRYALFRAIKLTDRYEAFAAGARLKMFSSDASRTARYPWRWPYVDISFYRQNATHIWDSAPEFSGYVYPKDVVFPLHKRPLADTYFDSPRDAYANLRLTYRSVDCTSSYYSHKYERVNERKRKRTTIPCELLRDSVPFVHRSPVVGPSVGPSLEPSVERSPGPSVGPSLEPSVGPSVERSPGPSVGPSLERSVGPSPGPSPGPSVGPSPGPSPGLSVGRRQATGVIERLMLGDSLLRQTVVDEPTYAITLPYRLQLADNDGDGSSL